MKTIITLFIAFATVTSAFAQSNRKAEEARGVILGPRNNSGITYPQNNGRDVILGGGSYPNSYPNTTYPSGNGSQIDQINREYDYRIASVQRDRTIRPAQKERIIRQLNAERANRIRQITYNNRVYKNNKVYSNQRNNERRYDDDRNEGRHDNGKHAGWEKGKGNPHREY